MEEDLLNKQEVVDIKKNQKDECLPKGKMAEDRAAEFLKNKGYKILARNIRLKKIEIDIVCTKENQIVIVEVKFRTTKNFFGLKKKQIENIKDYICMIYPNDDVRFDIILVTKEAIEHFEGCYFD